MAKALLIGSCWIGYLYSDMCGVFYRYDESTQGPALSKALHTPPLVWGAVIDCVAAHSGPDMSVGRAMRLTHDLMMTFLPDSRSDMTNPAGYPEAQAETTSVFRADLLKEMEAGAANASAPVADVSVPAGSGLLVVKRGPNAGARFLLDQATTTAGRHPESDIFLDDVTVSRRHAEFRIVDGAFQVVDLGSLNGTYVNREPQDSVVLNDGDEVQIGKFRLVFVASREG